MKKVVIATLFIFITHLSFSQTQLQVAENFTVKTVDSHLITLFDVLDENKIVVIDFFSISCGSCLYYAPHFQRAYEAFGSNQGNVFFLSMSLNSSNPQVIEFDNYYGITCPSVSGLDGGANSVFDTYLIGVNPTVIIITPDRQIVEQHVDPPSDENIIEKVIASGGVFVGQEENESIDNQNINIFPNPIINKLNLEFYLSAAQKATISIFDFQGKLLKQKQFLCVKNKNAIEIDFSNFPSSIYFISIESEKGTILKKKVIKQ